MGTKLQKKNESQKTGATPISEIYCQTGKQLLVKHIFKL